MFHSLSRSMQRTIAIVSIPNAGHIKVLTRLAHEAKQSDPRLNIIFILTSWLEHKIRNGYINALLEASGNEVIIFESVNTAHCKGDTFGRVRELTDKVIKACSGCDGIIYDFMTPEGYIAGKVLSIPTICAEPSYIGEFDIISEEYNCQVKKSANDLSAIEKEYKIELSDKLKLISGALSFPSSINLLFSWQNLIRAGDFERNLPEDKNKYYFLRPAGMKNPSLSNDFSYIYKLEKKVIYFSLGTVVSGIVWDETRALEGNSLRHFVTFLYKAIINIFTKRQDLILIISSGRNIDDIIGERQLPENIYTYESLNQAELLHHVDLFITHCGANSVNEAIDAETPMIGIPLMFDQHQCAQALLKLDIGHAFLLPPENRDMAIYFESNFYFRDPLNDLAKAQDALEKTIDELLSKDFSNAFLQAKSGSTLTFDKIHDLFKKMAP